MKAIQQELGEGNELQEEITQYRRKIRKAKLPGEAAEEAERDGDDAGVAERKPRKIGVRGQ